MAVCIFVGKGIVSKTLIFSQAGQISDHAAVTQI